jgi:hypothetical protein
MFEILSQIDRGCSAATYLTLDSIAIRQRFLDTIK